MDYKNKVIKIGSSLYGLVRESSETKLRNANVIHFEFEWSFRPYEMHFNGTMSITVYDSNNITVSSKEDVINLIKSTL